MEASSMTDIKNSVLDESKIGESLVLQEDVPFCASKDFPCEGEEKNMVYVCHYDSRMGYQTSCIPEKESDVLRYTNDECGPCKGSYEELWR